MPPPGTDDYLLKLEGAEIRDAIVVFCDIRGFSGWSSRHQHEIQRLLEITYGSAYELFGEKKEQRLPQRVVKFTGDGFLAVKEYASDSADALRIAAVEMFRNCGAYVRRFAERLGSSNLHGTRYLGVGLGVTYGKSLRFYIRGHSLDYVGDRVNLASRLADAADPGEIIAEEDFENHLVPYSDGDAAPRWKPEERELKKMGKTRVLVVESPPA